MPEDRFDVCVIGPVARDSNAVGTRELPPQPGGAAFYSTMVYLALGLRAAVVTRVAAADEAALLTGCARPAPRSLTCRPGSARAFATSTIRRTRTRGVSASTRSPIRSARATCRR